MDKEDIDLQLKKEMIRQALLLWDDSSESEALQALYEEQLIHKDDK